MVAKLSIQTRPLRLGGRTLGVGAYAVALLPNLDGKGMQLEVRQVDMRDVLPNLNAMAPLPKGETEYRAPVALERTDSVAERMTGTISEKDGVVTLAIRYGNRSFSLDFTR